MSSGYNWLDDSGFGIHCTSTMPGKWKLPHCDNWTQEKKKWIALKIRKIAAITGGERLNVAPITCFLSEQLHIAKSMYTGAGRMVSNRHWLCIRKCRFSLFPHILLFSACVSNVVFFCTIFIVSIETAVISTFYIVDGGNRLAKAQIQIEVSRNVWPDDYYAIMVNSI